MQYTPKSRIVPAHCAARVVIAHYAKPRTERCGVFVRYSQKRRAQMKRSEK